MTCFLVHQLALERVIGWTFLFFFFPFFIRQFFTSDSCNLVMNCKLKIPIFHTYLINFKKNTRSNLLHVWRWRLVYLLRKVSDSIFIFQLGQFKIQNSKIPFFGHYYTLKLIDYKMLIYKIHKRVILEYDSYPRLKC